MSADFRPPVKKGDIYAVLTSSVKRIIIIDGIFHNQPSVWQREILAALDDGIEVIGASSMGALRAAELHSLGMQGFGTVFDWYRNGVISGDDEVALLHATAEHGYKSFSEPLVNIRYTLSQARTAGVISADDESSLVSYVRELHYPQRSYESVRRSPLVASWPVTKVNDLATYLDQYRVNIKARDARNVLCAYAKREGLAVAEKRIVDLWNRDFRYMAFEYRHVDFGTGVRRRWLELAKRVWASPLWEPTRQRVLVRWYMLDWAWGRGLSCPDGHAGTFRRAWKVRNAADDFGAWSHARGLTERECLDVLEQHAMEEWLRTYSVESLGLALPPTPVAELVSAQGMSLDRVSLAYLLAWARENQIEVPASERAGVLERLGLTTEGRLDEFARQCGIPVPEVARLVDEISGAVWLMTREPTDLGRTYQLRMAGIHEIQFTHTPQELAALWEN
jgi:hypothetical protein